MKKILFRADAAPHIGIGDLMSLINISKYFDDNDEKYFIIKPYKAGIDLINKYGIENCFILDENISIDDEINYINTFIEDNNIDIVFFEITERKLSDYQSITSKVKKVAVNFDGHIPDNLDLVIDWDVEAYKFFEPKKYPNTKFLLGAEYVILPKEFYSDKVLSRKKNDIPKVLIAMGGADELNFTKKVVDAILSSDLEVELNIIIGSGYNYKKELEIVLKNGRLQYQLKQNITNMLDAYLNCDIGIGAGGLTSSEMVAAKISPILIATYEHQIARCKYFDQKGWAKYLGFRNCDTKELIDAVIDPLIIKGQIPFQTKSIIESINELK